MAYSQFLECLQHLPTEFERLNPHRRCTGFSDESPHLKTAGHLNQSCAYEILHTDSVKKEESLL